MFGGSHASLYEYMKIDTEWRRNNTEKEEEEEKENPVSVPLGPLRIYSAI